MKVAVKFRTDIPTIPESIVNVSDDIMTMTGYTVMTEIEYKQYLIDHKNDYDIYMQSVSNKIRGRILAAIAFGDELIADYCVHNVMKGYTIEEIDQIMKVTQKVMTDLQAGSLYVALKDLSEIQPDGHLITSDLIDLFTVKIKKYLGIS